MNTQHYTFYINDMRCDGCAIVIEDILKKQEGVNNAHVSFKNKTVELDVEGEKSREDVAKILAEAILPEKYTLSLNNTQKVKENNNDIIWQALPIGIFVLVLFFFLQKSGVLNFGIGGVATPTTSFLIGIVASLSSCLAVVGGLVLSFSAKILEDGKNHKKSIILFHIGRLGGFALLGGLLGLLGKSIGISFIFSAVLGLIASLIMIGLGLNLVGIFKNGKFTLPKGIFSFFRKVEHTTLAPLVIGVGTFFLPCGFTQSMQVASLSSGSFIGGLMIMFAFSLGTFPMLALISFGSMSFSHSKYAPLFFKSVGVVVIGLGIFALIGGLAGLGIIEPLFNI